MTAQVIPFPVQGRIDPSNIPDMYWVVQILPDKGEYQQIAFGTNWSSFRTAFGFYKLTRKRDPAGQYCIIPGTANPHYNPKRIVHPPPTGEIVPWH